MLNIEMVNATIEELEQADTTLFNCQNLAHLYIVREYFKGAKNFDSKEAESELKDILPQYNKYVDIKKKYQMKELSEDAVKVVMKDVCNEIKEFVHSLYRNSDMPSEREQIKRMISELSKEPL